MSACRSCQADVLFVPSAKNPDKNMILDLRPGKGIVLERLYTLDQVRAKVVDVYTDHHATCPNADQWVKRGRR